MSINYICLIFLNDDCLQIISLEVEDFSTNPCCDILFVHDGDSIRAPLLATLYGSYSEQLVAINSTQSYMYVRFTTGDQPTDRGFQVSYTVV
jgi:CUB domain